LYSKTGKAAIARLFLFSQNLLSLRINPGSFFNLEYRTHSMNKLEDAGTRNSFKKSERLCGHSLFALLFRDGKNFTTYPFRITWLLISKETIAASPVRVAFVVPKRNFKKASQRNRIRRRMKEAYRLNKRQFLASFSSSHDLLFTCVYAGREETEYIEIQNKIIVTLQKLAVVIKEHQILALK
jgi:ribonuclease P protein component